MEKKKKKNKWFIGFNLIGPANNQARRSAKKHYISITRWMVEAAMEKNAREKAERES